MEAGLALQIIGSLSSILHLLLSKAATAFQDFFQLVETNQLYAGVGLASAAFLILFRKYGLTEEKPDDFVRNLAIWSRPDRIHETQEGKGSAETPTPAWKWPAVASVALLLIVFVSILSYSSGAVPFAVVGSDSMNPRLQRGDLIYLKGPSPEEVEAGDIVAFKVPGSKQEQYGYPPQVIHRIKEVKHYDVGLYFETGGIATGKDPFRTSASDLMGVYGGVRMPYLGFVFLFLQTAHGQIYAAIVVVSLSLYTALPRWLERRREKEERVEKALESSKQTRGDIASFSNAMAEYAQHLQSHTAAVQELAETAKELREVVGDLDESVNSSAQETGHPDQKDPRGEET